MARLSKILLSVPKTIWFNLRYLPIIQAIKLPIWIASNVRVKKLYRGGLLISGQVKTGVIRLGYHEADAVDTYGVHTIISVEKGGKIIFKSDAHIGHGAIINVKKEAVLTLGYHFAISGTTSIICNKSITFGNDVQTSWGTLITDSDAHIIFSTKGVQINNDASISIGNKVWIAANTTVLKGSQIADNTVVASNSLVNRKFSEQSCIIGGSPARVLKSIGSFKI